MVIDQKSTSNGTLMKTVYLLPIILALLTINCSLSPNRYHPEYADHRPTIARILILPPEIDLFSVGPDGKLMLQDTQSQRASDFTQKAMIQTLSDQGFVARPASDRLLKTKEAVNLRLLYRNVNRAIQLHAYGPQVLPAKTKNFDYALGSVSNLLDASGADALLLVLGRQITSSDQSRCWISMAVVEPTGKIVWYGVRGKTAPIAEIVQQVVIDLADQVIQPFLERAS